jgi:hypothetical protein
VKGRHYIASLQTSRINPVTKEVIDTIHFILLNDLLVLVSRERGIMQHKDVFVEQIDLKYVRLRRSNVSPDIFDLSFPPIANLTDPSVPCLIIKYQGFYKCNSFSELGAFCSSVKKQTFGETVISYEPKAQLNQSKLLLHKIYETEHQWHLSAEHVNRPRIILI